MIRVHLHMPMVYGWVTTGFGAAEYTFITAVTGTTDAKVIPT
jgi:hypothetical protein